MDQLDNTQDDTRDDTREAATGQDGPAETLIEEVSIDGMCGVY